MKIELTNDIILKKRKKKVENINKDKIGDDQPSISAQLGKTAKSFNWEINLEKDNPKCHAEPLSM